MKNIKNSDSFSATADLATKYGRFIYFRLDTLSEKGVADVSKLPFSIKILLESIIRSENGNEVTKDDIVKLANYSPENPGDIEIPFKPARVLLQDFTGVPCVVDLAAMRSAIKRFNGDPECINPVIPVDLVIDHSVQVDAHNSPDALKKNTVLEFERNLERYEFLHWGQKAFQNFRIIPPSCGICHQVNLEYLARVIQMKKTDNSYIVFPDSLVGTDSHTTMINGLGIAGWGVGGIEAEVIGFKLTGSLPEGSNATDLVLTITELLRNKGVVGKFIEFYGPGLSSISVSERATVANMAPEYGATMGYFPVDDNTLSYLRSSGRPEELVNLVECYCRAQGIFRTDNTPEPDFKETIELDITTVRKSISGPKRPQDRIDLDNMKTSWRKKLIAPLSNQGFNLNDKMLNARIRIDFPENKKAEISHGSVVIASITSCTNTSNPSVMIAAGLLARNAVKAGLSSRPWVKTSFSPGSLVVTKYLKEAGLMSFLESLGFSIVGYGCMTCIGNSGPLPRQIEKAAKEDNIIFAGVVSGNRNFEGRVNPYVRASFLASPPLVVAYAIAGTVDIDMISDPIGYGADGKMIFLKDIWPSNDEVEYYVKKAVNPEIYKKEYADIERSNADWNRISSTDETLFNWKESSTYIQEPDFFNEFSATPRTVEPISDARALIMLGDSITTDHISPAGNISPDSPAGKYLIEKSVHPEDFNSYGSRRGNHNVMTRGTFANIRLKNILTPGIEGGVTVHFPTEEIINIYEAAMRYKMSQTPVIVIAGSDYGMGSSRDWAAKGAFLLGIKAVIADSFERIHRSNLLGMGVLPLQFKKNQTARDLGLTGRELYTILIDDDIKPGQDIAVEIRDENGIKKMVIVRSRLDTHIEVQYYKNGGILQTVLRNFLNEQKG